MDLSRALPYAASAPALLIAAQFCWVLADPLHPFNRDFAPEAWRFVQLEFMLLNATILTTAFARSLAGNPPARAAILSLLGLGYGYSFIFPLWRITEGSPLIVETALLLALRFYQAWNDREDGYGGRVAYAVMAMIVLGMLSVIALAPYPVPAFGFTPDVMAELEISPEGWSTIWTSQPQRPLLVGVAYFLLIGAGEFLLARPKLYKADYCGEGRIRLGEFTVFMTLASNGLAIEERYEKSAPARILKATVCVLIFTLGLSLLFLGEGFLAVALGLVVPFFSAVALIRTLKAPTRPLLVHIGQGGMAWLKHTNAHGLRRHVAPLGTIMNPYVTHTLRQARRTNEPLNRSHPNLSSGYMKYVTTKEIRLQLVIHSLGQTIRIDGFDSRRAAEALGKVITCVLKYGNDPQARQAAVELPGVRELLGSSIEHFLDPSNLPPIELPVELTSSPRPASSSG